MVHLMMVDVKTGTTAAAGQDVSVKETSGLSAIAHVNLGRVLQ
jgi:hypothetical protein